MGARWPIRWVVTPPRASTELAPIPSQPIVMGGYQLVPVELGQWARERGGEGKERGSHLREGRRGEVISVGRHEEVMSRVLSKGGIEGAKRTAGKRRIGT